MPSDPREGQGKLARVQAHPSQLCLGQARLAMLTAQCVCVVCERRLRNRIVSSAALDRGFRARGEPNPVWARNLILIIISHEPSQGLPPFLQRYPHNTHTPPPCSPTDLTSLRRFKGDYSTFITSSEVPLQT